MWFWLFIERVKTQALGIAAAVIGFAMLLFTHKRKVAKAKKTGRKKGVATERKRVQSETVKKSAAIKEKADEINKQTTVDTADADDLRKRMRDAATDKRSK